MSVQIRTSRTLTKVVRVTFGCDDCGMYGSTSVPIGWGDPDELVGDLDRGHACHTNLSAASVPSKTL